VTADSCTGAAADVAPYPAYRASAISLKHAELAPEIRSRRRRIGRLPRYRARSLKRPTSFDTNELTNKVAPGAPTAHGDEGHSRIGGIHHLSGSEPTGAKTKHTQTLPQSAARTVREDGTIKHKIVTRRTPVQPAGLTPYRRKRPRRIQTARPTYSTKLSCRWDPQPTLHTPCKQ
jgi:hypothetical protein